MKLQNNIVEIDIYQSFLLCFLTKYFIFNISIGEKYMKLFLKKNYLFIISFLILLIMLSISFFKYINEQKDVKEHMQVVYNEICANVDYVGTEQEEFCLNVLSDNKDFFYTFDEVMHKSYFRIASELFLFITVPCLYFICKYLSSKVIKNDLTRMNYKKVKLKLFKEAYKSTLILPVITIIAIIICFIYCGSITPNAEGILWSAETLSRPYLFLIVYVLNMFFHSIIYVNVCLCVARKYHNYFIALILSFLSIFGLEIFLEIFLGGILFGVILNKKGGVLFSIMNMITFNDTLGILPVIAFSLILALITTILVVLLYRNKEKLVIDCEAN